MPASTDKPGISRISSFLLASMILATSVVSLPKPSHSPDLAPVYAAVASDPVIFEVDDVHRAPPTTTTTTTTTTTLVPQAPPRSETTNQGDPHNEATWDRLAQCESGGDWHINTGNGYSGGLQHSPRTWTSHGGEEFAPYAYQASKEQQIIVAKRVYASQGWDAWPGCTRSFGWR